MLSGQVFPEHLLCAAQQWARQGEAGGRRSQRLGLRGLAGAGGVACRSALRLLGPSPGLQAGWGLRGPEMRAGPPSDRGMRGGVSAPWGLPQGPGRELGATYATASQFWGQTCRPRCRLGCLLQAPTSLQVPAASVPRPVVTWPLLSLPPVSPLLSRKDTGHWIQGPQVQDGLTSRSLIQSARTLTPHKASLSEAQGGPILGTIVRAPHGVEGTPPQGPACSLADLRATSSCPWAHPLRGFGFPGRLWASAVCRTTG